MKTTKLRLNDFLFNAGLLGFYRVIEAAGKLDYIGISGNQMTIQPQVFEHFEQNYIDYASHNLDGLPYDKLLEDYARLEDQHQGNDLNTEQLDQYIKYLKSKVESASYQSAFSIIESRDSDQVDVKELMKSIKQSSTIDEQMKILKHIVNFLIQHRTDFAMKDAAYNIINKYWENKAFLNRQAAKKDMMEEYRKVFVEKIPGYLEETKEKYQCTACQSAISKKGYAESFGFVSDMGVDDGKKQSHFWDFSPNVFLCPTCHLIYSCVPFGFHHIKRNGIFINNNTDIMSLIEDNKMIEWKAEGFSDNLQGYEKAVYGKLIQRMKKLDQTFHKMEMDHIQVVKRTALNRDNHVYKFNLLSVALLKFMLKNDSMIQSVIKAGSVTIQQERLYLYEYVVDSLVHGQSLYPLINNLLLQSFKENRNYWFLTHLLVLEEKRKGMTGGVDVNDKFLYMVKAKGNELRNQMSSGYQRPDDAKNKIRGFAYQLLNALKTRNPYRFMDLVSRLYISANKEIPSFFVNALEDTDRFQQIGYAFVIGLKGEYKDKEDQA